MCLAQQIMATPRVIRLEWHSTTRPHDLGMTSHSWLETLVSDPKTCQVQRYKLEFLAGQGFCETLSDELACVDTLWRRRVVTEFASPLSAERLRSIGRSLAANTYSTLNFNCHHWCLEVWNSTVPEAVQHNTYPDQWKCETGSMLGLSKFFDPKTGEHTGSSGSIFPRVFDIMVWALPEIV